MIWMHHSIVYNSGMVHIVIRRSGTLPLLLCPACLVLVSGGAVAAVERETVNSFAQGL